MSGVGLCRACRRGRTCAFAAFVAAAFVTLVADVGCRATERASQTGVSDVPLYSDVLGIERSGGTDIGLRIDDFGEFELIGSYSSQGHGTGAWDAELRANPEARTSLEGGGKEMKVGSVFVQNHVRRGSGENVGRFMMVKRESGYYRSGGNWEYVVIERDGRVAARGRLEMCARCHAESETDFVFVRGAQ